MFNNCLSLISLPEISKWKSKNSINMFNGCLSLINNDEILNFNFNKKPENINKEKKSDFHKNDIKANDESEDLCFLF